MPLRRQYLMVCLNRRADGSPKGSCAERGSEEIYKALRAALKERGMARVEARAVSCSCLDACVTGPSILVEPDHVMYGGVTMADLPEILDAIERGETVGRLAVDPVDFVTDSREPGADKR
jgi:(2Fe-2S) ferredoxin